MTATRHVRLLSAEHGVAWDGQVELPADDTQALAILWSLTHDDPDKRAWRTHRLEALGGRDMPRPIRAGDLVLLDGVRYLATDADWRQVPRGVRPS